jgi:hypothetical protein
MITAHARVLVPNAAFPINLSDFVVFLQMSALMLYPEMRKISAQEEEEDIEPVDDSTGSSGDQARKPNSEKRLMTQIPLTIMPCSSAVSLCVDPFIALKLNSLLHLTIPLQGTPIMFASFTLRLISRIFASLAAV